jgi:hypothetical protein
MGPEGATAAAPQSQSGGEAAALVVLQDGVASAQG